MTKRLSILLWAVAVCGLWSAANADDETVSRCAALKDTAKCSDCEQDCQGCPQDCEQACQSESHGPITALIELRKLFGDPLAGTALEVTACQGEGSTCQVDGFARAVARVAEEPREEICGTEFVFSAPPPPLPAPDTSNPFGPYYLPAMPPPPAIAMAPSEAQRAFVYWNAEPAGHHHVHHLRQSARQLESVASDLEDLGLYDKADELRQSAAALRQMARGTSQARVEVHTHSF